MDENAFFGLRPARPVKVKSRARIGPADPGFGRPGRLTTWVQERGKRQPEFGMEMQSNEVSGRNTDSPEAGSTRPLVPSTPAQGFIKERFCHKQSLPVTVQ